MEGGKGGSEEVRVDSSTHGGCEVVSVPPSVFFHHSRRPPRLASPSQHCPRRLCHRSHGLQHHGIINSIFVSLLSKSTGRC